MKSLLKKFNLQPKCDISDIWTLHVMPKQLEGLNLSFRDFIVLSNGNIIFCSPLLSKRHKQCGVYSYDPIHNAYTLLSQYPSGFGPKYGHSISYDPANNLVYIIHSVDANHWLLGSFHITTSKWHIIDNFDTVRTIAKYGYLGEHLRTVVIDSALHIIGGNHSNAHIIYRKHEIEPFVHINPNETVLPQLYCGFGLIKLSNNDLIACGGSCHGSSIQDMFRFDYEQKKWCMMSDIKMPNGSMHPRCALIGNIVVMFDGMTLYSAFDLDLNEIGNGIWYLDLNKNPLNWIRSTHSMPGILKAVVSIVIVPHSRSRIFIDGFCRMSAAGNTIPEAVCNLFIEFSHCHTVHLFGYNGKKHRTEHWTTNLDDLLQ